MANFNLITKMKNILKMINFKDLIKNSFFFFLPLFYICYIIYIRLILVRNARMLYIPLSPAQIVFTLIIIIFIVLRIYSLLKKEQIIKENTTENPVLLWIITKLSALSKYINNIWIEFYHRFTRYFLKVNFFILYFLRLIYTLINIKTALIIISLFELIPKLILVTAFLIDVFIYKQFYYFYKVLFLALLPLNFSTIRAILLQFHEDNYDALRSFLDIKPIRTDTKIGIDYSFNDDFEPPDYIKSLDDFIENHYLPVAQIPLLISHFEAVKVNYKLNWIFISILLLHLLGWLTILFFGIYI